MQNNISKTIDKFFLIDMPWSLTSLGLEPDDGQPTHMLPLYVKEQDAIEMQKMLKRLGKTAEIKIVRYAK